MEKEVKDALNFFIGTATTFKNEIDNIKDKVETEFKALAEKGAQDTSETAMNVRKYADETIKEFEKISVEVKAKFDETMTQIKKILPENTGESKEA